MGANFQLFCNIRGSPDPTINWFINETLIKTSQRIGFSADKKMLFVKSSMREDNAEFKCVGKNRFGSAEKSIHLRVTGTGIHYKLFFYLKNLCFRRASIEYRVDNWNNNWNSCGFVGFSTLHSVFLYETP